MSCSCVHCPTRRGFSRCYWQFSYQASTKLCIIICTGQYEYMGLTPSRVHERFTNSKALFARYSNDCYDNLRDMGSTCGTGSPCTHVTQMYRNSIVLSDTTVSNITNFYFPNSNRLNRGIVYYIQTFPRTFHRTKITNVPPFFETNCTGTSIEVLTQSVPERGAQGSGHRSGG